MKLPSLSAAARRRVAIPSMLAVAAITLACPSTPEPPTPACGAPDTTPDQTCVDDAGCTHDLAYATADDGGAYEQRQVSCPANGVCFFASADAGADGACVNSACRNVTGPSGEPLYTECQDEPDANPECYGVTDYLPDGGQQGHAVGC